MNKLLQQTLAGDPLDPVDVRAAFNAIMDGQAEPAWTGGWLIALQSRGVDANTLSAAAMAMRERMKPILVEDPGTIVDTCGTGGSGSGTFNLSTAAALVVAASGVRVVKHGNRRVSSLTGSADVLEHLGVNLNADPKACLDAAGVCFAFARNHHPAMATVAPVRQALGVRTVFNLLGPLCNPAGARRQLLGAGKRELVELMADALLRLGAEHAWVVYGEDGQDDLSTAAPSRVAEVKDGEVRHWTFDPSPHGLSGTAADLQADGPEASAAMIRRVLDNEEGPARDAVCLNAAAALVIAGGAADIEEGLATARHALDTGRAAETLDALATASNA